MLQCAGRREKEGEGNWEGTWRVMVCLGATYFGTRQVTVCFVRGGPFPEKTAGLGEVAQSQAPRSGFDWLGIQNGSSSLCSKQDDGNPLQSLGTSAHL